MSPGGHPSSANPRSLLQSSRYDRAFSGFFRCCWKAPHCSSETLGGAANLARGEEPLGSELLMVLLNGLGADSAGVGCETCGGADSAGVQELRGLGVQILRGSSVNRCGFPGVSSQLQNPSLRSH